MTTVGRITQLTQDQPSLPKRIAAPPPVRSDPLLAEAASLVQQLQDELEICLTTYAMPEEAQANIMRLLREATLFRRKVSTRPDRREEAQ